MPPFDYDLGDAGKGLSDGWMFWTCYNTERATGKLEVTASQRDRDYIAAIDWRAAEKAVGGGQGRPDRRREGPRSEEGARGRLLHALRQVPARRGRVARRQVDRRLRASCRASPRSFNFEKIQTAIRNKDFTGDEDGIPVLKYESIKDAEVQVGLGPLHTQFGAGWLRLHVAVRRQRHRQVEARHVGGRGQGAHVLQHRPPLAAGGRHGPSPTASTWSGSTSSPTAGTCPWARRSPSPRSSSTSPKRR